MPVVSTKVAWTDKIVTALHWGDSPLNMGGEGVVDKLSASPPAGPPIVNSACPAAKKFVSGAWLLTAVKLAII